MSYGSIKKSEKRRFWPINPTVKLVVVTLIFQAIPAWGLTLEEAVTLAVQTNPDVRAAKENKKSVSQKVEQTVAGYLPSLDFSAGYGREQSDNTTTRVGDGHELTLNRGEMGLTVRQMVFDGFDVRYNVAKAQAQLQSAQANMKKESDRIVLLTAESYLDVVIKKAQLALIKENVSLHQRILEKVKLKFESGAGNEADVHQAQSRTYLAFANHASSQALYQNALSAFKKIVGMVPVEDLTLPQLSKEILPDSLQSALDVALKDNPKVQGARFDLMVSEAEHKSAGSDFWPKVDLELAATNNGNVSGSIGHNKAASAMMRLRYNLYQGGRHSANLQGALNQRDQAHYKLDSVGRTLIDTMNMAWNRVVQAQERLGFLEKHVAVSERVTASYHGQFKMGKRTLLDVLNSENELFSAMNALLTEKLSYGKAAYQVLSGMGVLQRVLTTDIKPSSDTPTM